jgi:hypothetical protein
MAAAKTKLLVAAAAGVLLAGVTGTIAYQEFGSPGARTRQVFVDPAAAAPSNRAPGARLPTTLPADPQWKDKFNAVYALQPGEVAKHIAAPYIPARLQFYRNWSEPQFQAIPRGPDMMYLQWDERQRNFSGRGMLFGPPTVSSVVADVLGIHLWDVVGSDDVMNRPASGDWVTRADAEPTQVQAAVMAELSKSLGAPMVLQQVQTEREVIVIRGTFQPHPITTQPYPGRGNRIPIVFYRGTTQPARTSFGGGSFVERVASVCREPVVVEGPFRDHSIDVLLDRSAYMMGAKRGSPQASKEIDELLANLAKQTSLQFSRERRVVPAWTMVKTSSPTAAPAATAATQPVARASAAP